MDRVYVGWRYAQAHPDPGPEPRRPEPVTTARATWVEAAQEHGGEKLLNRQLKFTAAGAGCGRCGVPGLRMTGLLFWPFVLVGLVACAVIIGITAGRSGRASRPCASAAAPNAPGRTARSSGWNSGAPRPRTLPGRPRNWEKRREAYETQREWHPVTVPSGVDRLDIAGGTLSGWAAAVTMMGSARLAPAPR
jgi:hypothetical protein